MTEWTDCLGVASYWLHCPALIAAQTARTSANRWTEYQSFQRMAASHAVDACSDVMRFWIEAGCIVRQYQVKIGSVDMCHAAPVGCRLRRFAFHEPEATNSKSSVDAHAPYFIGHHT